MSIPVSVARPVHAVLRPCLLLVAAIPIAAQNPIVVENQLAGVPASVWYVPGPGDANIQGYATDLSVNVGGTVRFKIDTSSPAYHIDVYRLGWYQGLGARLVGSGVVTATLPQSQPAGIYDPPTAMLDCGNWTESAHWDVPANAVSGIYLAKLERDDPTPGTSHILFVVRDDASTSDIVMKTNDGTWQAYNLYGGASMYPAGGAAPGYNHATKASYNRPFDLHNAAGGSGYDFFAAEYAMVRFLEANGYDVSYLTCVDCDRNGALIQQHGAFVSVGHDEYWSGPMRDSVEAARDAGVHLAFFSGNEVYWKTRYEPSIDGNATPHRTLVCYKEGTLGENACGSKCDPSPQWTGLWRDGCAPTYNPLGNGACRPESTLTGQYSWDGTIGAIQVPYAYKDLRFWRHTTIPSLLPGQTATLGQQTLGHEWDPQSAAATYPSRRILLSNTLLGGRTHHLSLYRANSGALVFGAGTVQWSWGLDDFHTYAQVPSDPVMRQATVNLFADMGISPESLQAGLTPATASSDTQPPSSIISMPTAGQMIPVNGTVGIQGIAMDTGGGIVAGVEVSVDNGMTWQPAVGTTNWSFAWTPAAMGPVTIRSRAFDDTANLETSTGSGMNAVNVTVTAPSCPCTVFGTAIPVGAPFNDSSPIEVGMRLRVDVPGTITKLRYYKNASITGTRTGSLWTNTGAILAQLVFTGETASGWQEVDLTTPVPVQPGVTYVVSCFSSSGDYFATPAYFTQQVGSGLVHGLADGFDGPNGVYLYGAAPAFPTQTFNSANYFVDVVFETTPDVTPPMVTARSPMPGTTVPATTSTVTATFDEALDPATVNGATFVLRDGGNALVPATVAWAAGPKVATLAPTSPLLPQTTYTATLRGGTTDPRIKDLAGNALAANVVWSFTTAALPRCPCTVFAANAGPAGPLFNDSQPIALGMKFRADRNGLVTGLRYYKFAGTTGVHVGNLWSATGLNLAQATFTNETASGWQEILLDVPVPVTANTTYVVSYHSPSGDYVSSPTYFTQPAGTGYLTGLADGVDGPNGVYVYSATPTFPTASFMASNYWADVVFYQPTEARSEVFGAGCAGTSNLVPALAAVGVPPLPTQPNATLGLRLTDARALSAVVFVAGFARASAMPCELLVGSIGPTWLVFTDIMGRAAVPLPLPATPSATGLQIWVQAGVWDPAGGSTFFPGLALSGGLRLTLGN
ncbi:MAG: DUF4082 domain-containing protein [Planctomycetes bacterium]|nr:DUF4082 domain-containing protein [Planctomycetota bacterium]